jgi:hypothetical protein
MHQPCEHRFHSGLFDPGFDYVAFPSPSNGSGASGDTSMILSGPPWVSRRGVFFTNLAVWLSIQEDERIERALENWERSKPETVHDQEPKPEGQNARLTFEY